MVDESENAVSPEVEEKEGALEDRLDEEAGTRSRSRERRTPCLWCAYLLKLSTDHLSDTSQQPSEIDTSARSGLKEERHSLQGLW